MGLLSTAKMYVKGKPKKLDAASDLYAHEVTLLEGEKLDLETLRGHPTLIVNTASKCGFTPQYGGLQELYDEYRERGLRVLGTPSGDFAEQELAEASEIGEFCQRNYGVTFPLTEKQSVRAEPSPLWDDIARQPGSNPPSWNFTKYLVGADGKLIAQWGPKTTPTSDEIRGAIEQALGDSA
jgi:glutathione peroxidase